MSQKIQLMHPAGKKAVRIDKEKYDLLRKSIAICLKTNGESTHEEISQRITEDFKKNKIHFEGSLDWYLEWVKLDMEARKEIKRSSGKSPARFIVT